MEAFPAILEIKQIHSMQIKQVSQKVTVKGMRLSLERKCLLRLSVA